MDNNVEKVIEAYIKELHAKYPEVVVDKVEPESRFVDAALLVQGVSDDEDFEVMKTLAHLTTKHYIEDGVYVQGST